MTVNTLGTDIAVVVLGIVLCQVVPTRVVAEVEDNMAGWVESEHVAHSKRNIFLKLLLKKQPKKNIFSPPLNRTLLNTPSCKLFAPDHTAIGLNI